MNLINVKQINNDIFLAERIFGKSNVLWDKNFHWIMIQNYELPRIYNQRFTNCLIIIPTGYGYGSKLEEFYLNKGIKVKQNGQYTELPHYFEGNVHKGHSYIDKNWQWLCINPEWDKGDNLITFMKQVELFLKFPFDERID